MTPSEEGRHAMSIDHTRIGHRGTGPLHGPAKPRPHEAATAAEAPPRRAPGTSRLDPDALLAHAAFESPVGPPPEIATREAVHAIDRPAWVGVKRKLAELEARGGLPNAERLEKYVARYAEHGGDPKVARAILKQIEHPLDNIAQTGANTCAAAGPQIELARKNPARYFRVMGELDMDGSAQIQTGKILDTGEKNFEAIEDRGLPPNERLNALFQAAGMEYANLTARYDVTKDTSMGVHTSYKGVDEDGAGHFAKDLLDGKTTLIGHQRLNRRIAALVRDHEETGARLPSEGELRVRAVAQLVSEGRERGIDSFFLKLDVPGGKHDLILEDIGPKGATLADHKGRRHMSLEQLAHYISTTAGRAGYDPGMGTSGISWGARGSRRA
jgi:hypothetical protein